MVSTLRTMGRALASHGVMLATWYLAGEAVHELFLQLAGRAGAVSSVLGLLVLPLAALGRLVAYVAMFLTIRDSLPHVRVEQSEPLTAAGRRREFVSAILVSILPFLAFYTAWGLLDEDRNRFSRIALDILVRTEGFSGEFAVADRAGIVGLGFVPILIVAIALLVRFVLARWSERLPGWISVLAVYAEALWVFLLMTFVTQQMAGLRDWLDGRAVALWIGDAAAAVTGALPWLGEVGSALGMVIGLLGPAVLLPLAWITVAGLVYGRALESAETEGATSHGVVRGFRRLIGPLARRIDELWDAVTFLFAAGPVPVGLYLLAFALWGLGAQLVSGIVVGVFGPQESSFWDAWSMLLVILIGLLTEPIRIVLIAATFDTVLGRLEDAGPSRDDVPSDSTHGTQVRA